MLTEGACIEYVSQKLKCTRNLAVDFSTSYDAVFFTDGSKMVCEVGAGDFANKHSVSKSNGLPGFVAMLETCRCLRHDQSSNRNILTDSQMTIKPLYSAGMPSRLVKQ